MQNNTTEKFNGQFHKVGVSFGNAGAIVRMSAGHKIMTVLASWLRTRSGDTDRVFVTSPQALAGPAENLVTCVALTGDAAKKRYDLTIRPDQGVMDVMSYASADGYWAVIYMDRIGQSPDFRSLIYRLDEQWRLVSSSATPVPNLTKFLNADFVEVAEGMPSGWPIMYSASALFGGQDPADLPPEPANVPADLATAVALERRFRSGRRKLLAMSPREWEAFTSQLDSEQLESAVAIRDGRRSHI